MNPVNYEKVPILKMYRMARLIRRSQEILMDEYHPADEMRCPIHFCVGQESAPAALASLLREDDVVMSHHRSHGYYLAKGGSLEEMVAEFYGKESGCNGGLAGSQELSRAESNFFSGTILSGMFAMASGSAFAQKYNETDGLTVAVIGDGGMEEGIVFETLNLAAVFNLPIIFICENNLYSAHTRIDKRSLSKNLLKRARAFDVGAELMDGNDPIILRNEFQKIFSEVRSKSRPFFVEIETYRLCGHVGPENDDVLEYRSMTELQEWKKRDPVAYLRSVLLEMNATTQELESLEDGIDAEVNMAINRAKQSPFPKIDAALAMNASNSFSPVVSSIRAGEGSDFDGNQNETKLAPY